jgi:hypothetical protein
MPLESLDHPPTFAIEPLVQIVAQHVDRGSRIWRLLFERGKQGVRCVKFADTTQRTSDAAKFLGGGFRSIEHERQCCANAAGGHARIMNALDIGIVNGGPEGLQLMKMSQYELARIRRLRHILLPASRRCNACATNTLQL